MINRNNNDHFLETHILTHYLDPHTGGRITDRLTLIWASTHLYKGIIREISRDTITGWDRWRCCSASVPDPFHDHGEKIHGEPQQVLSLVRIFYPIYNERDC